MNKEILTAKEWLDKENYYEATSLKTTEQGQFDYPISVIMERYASYKTKVLEDRILEFRSKLLKITLNKVGYVFDSNDNLYVKYDDFVYKHQTNIITEDLTLNEFDKHFNITTE